MDNYQYPQQKMDQRRLSVLGKSLEIDGLVEWNLKA